MAQKNFKVNNGLTTPVTTFLYDDGNTANTRTVNVSTSTASANYSLQLPPTSGALTPAVLGDVTLDAGDIDSIAITSGGSGYTTAPAVIISGDGSYGIAHAELTNGVVTSIVIDNPGSGYTTATATLSTSGARVLSLDNNSGNLSWQQVNNIDLQTANSTVLFNSNGAISGNLSFIYNSSLAYAAVGCTFPGGQNASFGSSNITHFINGNFYARIAGDTGLTLAGAENSSGTNPHTIRIQTPQPSTGAWASYILTLPRAAPNSNGAILTANTDGTMTFTAPTIAQPTIKFTASSNGNNQTFTDANIASFANSNAYSSVYRNGILIDSANYAFSGNVLTVNVQLFNGDTIDVAPTTVISAGGSGGTPGGSNTQVQFNDAGSFGGNSSFTFNKSTAVLTVTTLAANTVRNGNSNIAITANANVTITANGNAVVAITSSGDGNLATTGINIAGYINTTGNLTAASFVGALSNGNSNIAILSNSVILLNANGQSNIVNVSSNGTHAQTTFQDDVLITGNITVEGNTNYINVDTYIVQDPIIELGAGANGAAPAENAFDLGTLLRANTAGEGAVNRFMGWDTSNAEFGFGNNVSDTSNIVTFTNYANVRAGNFIGKLANGNSNIAITSNANVTITANSNVVATVTSSGDGNLQTTGVNVAGYINATGTITANTGGTSSVPAGYAIGYRDIPQVAASNATLALEDAGKHFYSTTAGNLTLTIPSNASVAFSTGAAITIVVQAAGNVLVNAASGVSLFMAGNSTAANRVVGTYGVATLMKVAANTWFINGTSVT